VTSNHIHLLVKDGQEEEVIPRTMQLIAGRTGQEYNQRKNRKGAFWEDRYHATAVEADHHLIQCMVYVDLNMVRAGVVAHPSEWAYSGYNEIQNPRERYSLIDHGSLADLLGIKSMEELKRSYRGWVEGSLSRRGCQRESRWTQSIAVGSKAFVEKAKADLGAKAMGREVLGVDGVYELREQDVSYSGNLGGENSGLRLENTYFWDIPI
jgi:putative transposase